MIYESVLSLLERCEGYYCVWEER